MKRLIAILTSVMLILCMTSAFALSWTDADTEQCTEYTVTVDKYAKVQSDVGTAYEKNAKATASVGDTVYFSVTAVGTQGEPVTPEVEFHNLGNVEAVGKIFRAQVVGSKPYIKASIIEKTPLDELSWNGNKITITSSTVVIGNLTFTRDTSGKVTDVSHTGNAAEMLKDLSALNLSVVDIYDGKVCMTDDILTANFGKVCKTESVAAWYEASENVAIPKTGDMSVLIPATVCAAILAASIVWRKR